MTFEDALYDYLSAQSAFTTLLGVDSASVPCLFPSAASQDRNYPYVTFLEVSGKSDRTQAGYTGLMIKRVQFTVFGIDTPSCNAVGNQLLSLLDGHNNWTMSGLSVLSFSLDNSLNMKYPTDTGSGQFTYGKVLDFKVQYFDTLS